MRIYSVQTKFGNKIIEADELKFETDEFYCSYAESPLVFRREGKIFAVFRFWDEFMDITDKHIDNSN
jgi:hypothetical protein